MKDVSLTESANRYHVLQKVSLKKNKLTFKIIYLSRNLHQGFFEPEVDSTFIEKAFVLVMRYEDK
jgi:hypothetical protein